MLNKKALDNRLDFTLLRNQSKNLRIKAEFRCRQAELVRIKAQFVLAKSQLITLAFLYINSKVYQTRVPAEFEL